MAWVLLLVAGLLEVGWAIGLKYTEGLHPAVAERLHAGGDGGQCGAARRGDEVAAGGHGLCGVGRRRGGGRGHPGMVLFGEAANLGRLPSLALIVAGIVGLKAGHGGVGPACRDR